MTKTDEPSGMAGPTDKPTRADVFEGKGTTLAYLGPQGTYSEEAAQCYSSQASLHPCANFDDIITAVEQGQATHGLLPVENSTEGTVSRTLDLLRTTTLTIVGEVFLPIHHQLLGKADSLQQVQQVLGHSQALGQCRQWLAANVPHATQVSAVSNGEAAKQAAANPPWAAIASIRASRQYELPILANNIEDEPSNTTRFLVVASMGAQPTGNDKTSLVLATRNVAGALYQVLGVFAARQINMTKVESRPVADKPWEYLFYIDIDGHRDDPTVASALQEMQQHTTFLRVLGSYPKAYTTR